MVHMPTLFDFNVNFCTFFAPFSYQIVLRPTDPELFTIDGGYGSPTL